MNTLSSESIKRGYRVVYALGNTDNILREVSDGVELVPINSKIPQADSGIGDYLRVLARTTKEYRKLKTTYRDALYVAISAGAISLFRLHFCRFEVVVFLDVHICEENIWLITQLEIQ